MPSNFLSTYSISNIPKEMYIFYGGFSYGNAEEAFNPLYDSFIAQRIPDNNKKLVTENKVWQANKTYVHYSSTTNYDVAWNDENGVMYLCLHNNTNFRDDNGDGEPGLSTQKPNHIGKKTYSDGYTWLSLWKVDYTDYNFITGSELPLPNLSTDPVYTTFTQKYQTLCGSQGTTSFGCCCLYFKDNFTDEITGEVYNEGDLTNEIIFSDCYECQKAAEAFNRDVIFLTGITVGGITLSHPGENPLCPATKTIQGLKERLEEDVYDLVPGSAKEFQYFQLKNHNNLGIMSVSLDFSNLSEAERTISVANPTITFTDALGSGGSAVLKTYPVQSDSHYVYGIELVSEGSQYTQLPTPNNSNVSSAVLGAININVYPENIYENTEVFTPANGLRITTSITQQEIASTIDPSIVLTKAAIITDPKNYSDGSPLIKPPGDKSVSRLLTNLFAFDPTAFTAGLIVSSLAGAGGNNNIGGLGPDIGFDVYPDQGDSQQAPDDLVYSVYSVYATPKTRGVEYNGVSGGARGYDLSINDDPGSINPGNSIVINGVRHKIYSVSRPTINAKTANYYDTINFTDTPIGITSIINQTTVKAYEFNLKLNI